MEKTACVINQFNNFTVEVLGETLNVNGINTQGRLLFCIFTQRCYLCSNYHFSGLHRLKLSYQRSRIFFYLRLDFNKKLLGENVADLSGLKAAIRTYEKIVESLVM